MTFRIKLTMRLMKARPYPVQESSIACVELTIALWIEEGTRFASVFEGSTPRFLTSASAFVRVTLRHTNSL